jgi:hypothetical protein
VRARQACATDNCPDTRGWELIRLTDHACVLYDCHAVKFTRSLFHHNLMVIIIHEMSSIPVHSICKAGLYQWIDANKYTDCDCVVFS